MKTSYKTLFAVAIYMTLMTPIISYAQCNRDLPSRLLSGGLPDGFDSTYLTLESIQLPFPTFIWTLDSNEVYIMGGQPLGLDLYVNDLLTGNPGTFDPTYYGQFFPYVAQFNPVTQDTLFLPLTGGPGIPYLGGIAKHPNGYLYAVAQARVFKIDPATMTIVQFIDMPLPDPQTIYNGIDVSNNGALISKSTDLSNFNSGQFLMLDPNTLQIITDITVESGSARTRLACDDAGNEYIYHLNQNYTFRIQVTDDSLIMDTTWQAATNPYGDGTLSEPTSPQILGNRVLYTTNTSYTADRAMKIFWQRTDQSYSLANDTLSGYYMFSDTISPGYSFTGLIIDTLTGIIIGQDQANRKVAAYQIDQNDQLQYLWEKDYGISGTSFIAENTSLLYLNDFDYTEGIDYLVVLDLFTGNELGRIKTPATAPSIATPGIGTYNDFYYCSNGSGQPLGYFHRFSLDSTIVTSIDDFVDAPTDHLKLYQNYPNPFNSQTMIGFELPKASNVRLAVYNAMGELEAVLLNEVRPSGFQEVNFEASNLGAGIHFYQIETPDFRAFHKMILSR